MRRFFLVDSWVKIDVHVKVQVLGSSNLGVWGLGMFCTEVVVGVRAFQAQQRKAQSLMPDDRCSFCSRPLCRRVLEPSRGTIKSTTASRRFALLLGLYIRGTAGNPKP